MENKIKQKEIYKDVDSVLSPKITVNKELFKYDKSIFQSTKLDEANALFAKLRESGELDIFEERERLRKEKLDAENNDK